ncbi:MAG TPA: DUF2071 domain-containing protein [Flavisolibacter sp.]|jgi:hypothetical protein|nr:DUF2071 domain-containing protein [Flavisolibacter sp.]
MPSFLQNHPFPVVTHFEHSLVLTYAVPVELLTGKLPPCLVPDTYQEQWAFVAMAVVQAKNLRPRGFPEWLGHDFTLAGYRVFVRYTTSQGKRLRGLYILKSETDKKSMSFLGNIFTQYRYTTTDIQFARENQSYAFRSVASDWKIRISKYPGEASLPPGSPFKDLKEARHFAGPLPFTFHFNERKHKVLIIEGVRQNWIPQPVQVLEARISWIDAFCNGRAQLANAFMIQDIPYYWKKGRTDLWKP